MVPGPVAVSDYPGAWQGWPASLLALRFPGLVRVARQGASHGSGHFAALAQPRAFAAEAARSVEAMVEATADATADARAAANAKAKAEVNANAGPVQPRSANKKSTYSSSTYSSSSSGSSGHGPPASAGKYGTSTSRGGEQRAAHGAVERGPPDLATKTAKHPAGTLMYNPELHGSKRPKGGVYRPKEAWKPQELFAR